MKVRDRDHGKFLHSIHALGLSHFQARDLLGKMPARQLKDYFGTGSHASASSLGWALKAILKMNRLWGSLKLEGKHLPIRHLRNSQIVIKVWTWRVVDTAPLVVNTAPLVVNTAPLVVNTAPLVVNTALPRPVTTRIDQQGRITHETINPNASEAASSFYAKQKREAAFQAKEEARDRSARPSASLCEIGAVKNLSTRKNSFESTIALRPTSHRGIGRARVVILLTPAYFAELCARRNAREY